MTSLCPAFWEISSVKILFHITVNKISSIFRLAVIVSNRKPFHVLPKQIFLFSLKTSKQTYVCNKYLLYLKTMEIKGMVSFWKPSILVCESVSGWGWKEAKTAIAICPNPQESSFARSVEAKSGGSAAPNSGWSERRSPESWQKSTRRSIPAQLQQAWNEQYTSSGSHS